MYSFFKRFLDILLSLLGLLLTFWIMVPCMLILRLTGEHYIWYRQKRVGFRNRRFNIIKFATMLKDSPKLGTGSLTVRNDSRVLPFGKFLRKTKLNELPQIFNVLNGTMSIVGPRPQMEIDFKRFPEVIQSCIYDSVPGITGIGSVIFRDEEYYMSQPGIDPIDFYTKRIAPYKGELEIWYLSHKNLWVDFVLIFLTAWVIVFPKSHLPFKCFPSLPNKPTWLE